ncbi:MAG: DUF2207 domain-containing protein [Marinicellaceae bacterium]
MKWFIFFVLFWTLNSEVTAREKITDFHSRIDVMENGDILVKETIEVIVENNKIRHGIFRSTPTVYYGIFFTHKNSDIIIISTQLNGDEVSHHKENLINGIRVYLGSKDYYVRKGRNTYVIEYIAKGQIKDLEQNNGLYWNVTGNDWDFAIDKARTDIYMPNLVNYDIISEDAWTGNQGSTAKNYQFSKFQDHIRFETTSPLSSKQGLTVQATWAKGFITNKPLAAWVFIKNNFFWLLSVTMLLLYPLYFYKTWKKVGIDPPKGAVFPQFKPPNNISPAAMQYVSNNYYDTKSFSVAIMNLAVKKYISIEQKSKKEYKLTQLNKKGNADLSRGEARIYDYIFRQKKSITLDKTYNSTIKTADGLLKSRIVNEHKAACFKDNLKQWIVGVGISLVMVLINWAHFFNFSSHALPFLISSFGVILFSATSLVMFKKPYQKLIAGIIAIIIVLMVFISQSEKVYSAYVALVLIMVAVNAVFYHLIKAPTVFGRKLMDDIEGFKMYLQTAEQDRLEIMHPPEMTPELFEKYLPYALALGVENKWSQQFNNTMKIQGKDSTSYQPSWYIGNNYSHTNFATTATALGAGLASSVVSASTPPSSNSSGGFSGGGFSGGGGGGGGGGGW